jgi:hypothetical protein
MTHSFVASNGSFVIVHADMDPNTGEYIFQQFIDFLGKFRCITSGYRTLQEVEDRLNDYSLEDVESLLTWVRENVNCMTDAYPLEYILDPYEYL